MACCHLGPWAGACLHQALQWVDAGFHLLSIAIQLSDRYVGMAEGDAAKQALWAIKDTGKAFPLFGSMGLSGGWLVL